MKYQHFSIEERERIEKGLWDKRSIRSIARGLKRSPGSVSREIRRARGSPWFAYKPRIADARAQKKRHSRGRSPRLKSTAIRTYVIEKLQSGYSPEQAAGRLFLERGLSISHEAIYQYIYAQVHRGGRGLAKPGHLDLRMLLKRRHKARTKHGMRTGLRVLRSRGPSIETRPRVVEKRSRLGDWEGDMIMSKGNTAGLNSLVERKSGYALLTRVLDKTAETTATTVINRLAVLPLSVRHTLTLDNGTENQHWQHIEQALDLLCFYAHPYCSGERGTNENTNGLVRWYYPKGTDFKDVSDEAIACVEYALNTRPRKRLGWKTPLEVMAAGVALRG